MTAEGPTVRCHRSSHSDSQHLAGLAFVVGLAILTQAPLPALAPVGPETAAAEQNPQDPVIAEVVRLLESGLGEPVILRWLAEEHRPSGRPTADELIALKRAGATDELVAVLLDLATAGNPAPAPARPEEARQHPTLAPAAPAAASTPAPLPPAAPEPAREAASEPPSIPPLAPAASGPLSLALSVVYIHEPDEGVAWDLVVYLDGQPFAPVPAARTARNAEPSRTLRDVAPGLHVLRWAQERHGERPGERGLHAARFDPEPLAFTLAGGAPAEIAFEFRDPSGIPFTTAKGPITVRVSQGGEEVDARQEGGGEAARWPNLCEEIEANLAGGKPAFQDRMMLKKCLRWADLWSALPGPVPDRDSVRQRLAP